MNEWITDHWPIVEATVAIGSCALAAGALTVIVMLLRGDGRG